MSQFLYEALCGALRCLPHSLSSSSPPLIWCVFSRFFEYRLIKDVTKQRLKYPLGSFPPPHTFSATLRWLKTKHSLRAVGILDRSFGSARVCALCACVCANCPEPELNVSQLTETSLDSLISPGFVASPSVSLRWQRGSTTAEGTQQVKEYTHAHNHKSGKSYVLWSFLLFIRWQLLPEMWWGPQKELEASDKAGYFVNYMPPIITFHTF